MSYSEVYNCDRAGCKNHSEAIAGSPRTLSPAKFPFKNDSWIRRNTVEVQVLVERDFCSLECEAVWCDEELKVKMKGGK